MGKTLYRVFAGNRHEYAEFMRVFERSHSDCRYITGPEQLRGHRNVTIFLVGNYRDNKHFREVYERIILDGHKIVEVQFK
jgi:hypothetical protein